MISLANKSATEKDLSNKSNFQSPRVSLIWISVAQLVCTLPHFFYMPWWVIALCGICFFWRVMVYQGRWNYPGRYVRYAFVILALFAMLLYFPKIVSIEAAVTLLIITYYMKLLEMFRLKDVYIILILSYFVIASAFILNENIIMLGYFIIAFVLTTVALLSSNRTEARLDDGDSFKKGLILCLQAAPVGLCLFLFFPRFPPFWTLDLSRDGPSVGISERMSPADVASLGAAEGVAFRVEFDGPVPPPEERYWRVLTLTEFDGVEWSTLFSTLQSQLYFEPPELQARIAAGVSPVGLEYKYHLSLEPTQQRWLPTLDRPVKVSRKSTQMPDFTLLTQEPIATLIDYRGISAPDAILEASINTWLRKKTLELPAGFNEKSIEYAKKMHQRLDNQDQVFIDHIMKQFHELPFFYTLSPGRYSDQMVDEFFFERRKGFCAHFASTMVVMLRAVGIPSRMVIGYQGGELNPLGGHIVVNQYDAHAWVEAWSPGDGWRRYDPTSMVAPWRLLLGVEEMLRRTAATEVPSLQQSLLRSNKYTNKLRLFLDYTNHRWNKHIVNFDQEAQLDMLKLVFEKVNLQTLVLLMVASISTLLGFLALLLFWQSKQQNSRPEDRILANTLQLIEKRYFARLPGTTLEHYYQSLEKAMNSTELQLFRDCLNTHSQIAYAKVEPEQVKGLLRVLGQQSRRLNRQLQHIQHIFS